MVMSVCCYIRRAVMICVCTLGTVSLGAEFRVDTVDGMKIEGTVVSCDDRGLRLSVAGNETDIALDNVSKLTAINATGTDRPPSGIHLQLIGGTDLFVDQFSSDANQSTMTFADGTRQVIAASLVRTARLKSPSEEFNERWRELASGEYETDVLVIRKSGGNLDFVKGIIGAIGETHVGFEFDGQEIQVARERIEGLVYFTKSKDAPGEAFCRVLVTSGGSIRGQGLKWDGDHFVVSIGRDAQLTLPPQLVQTVEFASNKTSYLSDLEPASVITVPRISSVSTDAVTSFIYKPRRDRSLHGGPLLLDFPGEIANRQEFAKGMSLHSRTELVWRLDGQYRRLKAIAGIDPRFRGAGNVKLVISGDNKILWESAVIGSEPPLSIDIDIADVRRLSLLVDYGDQTDVADHLNLCNLRVTK